MPSPPGGALALATFFLWDTFCLLPFHLVITWVPFMFYPFVGGLSKPAHLGWSPLCKHKPRGDLSFLLTSLAVVTECASSVQHHLPIV